MRTETFMKVQNLIDCVFDIHFFWSSAFLHRGKKWYQPTELQVRWSWDENTTRSWGCSLDQECVEFHFGQRWHSQVLHHLKDGKLLSLTFSVSLSTHNLGRLLMVVVCSRSIQSVLVHYTDLIYLIIRGLKWSRFMISCKNFLKDLMICMDHGLRNWFHDQVFFFFSLSLGSVWLTFLPWSCKWPKIFSWDRHLLCLMICHARQI